MGRIIAVFFLVFGLALVYFLSSSESASVISPIPKVFGVAREKEVVLNDWFPEKSQAILKPYELGVGAKSALLTDYDSGEIIFSKNTGERLPAASTVKIMTALVALESKQISDNFTVSEKSSKVGENSMGLVQGEVLTLEDLLYGLMLVSGNDAAVAIAEGVSGSEEAFVDLMNDKAKQLGLSDTKFINASGLDEDGRRQYTTAYDLSVISRYVWNKYPAFRKIASTEHIYIEAGASHRDFDLYNDTNLLTTYPGVKGIKPGFTWEAGLCLVTYVENEDRRFIGVILGSDDRRGEMKELLDYGFAAFGITVSHPALDL